MNEKYIYSITLEKKLDTDVVVFKPTVSKISYDISKTTFEVINKMLLNKIIEEVDKEIQEDFKLKLKQKIKEKLNE